MAVIDSAIREKRIPFGWKWRSSVWYITSVVALGICTDLVTYTIVVPVLPFRLQSLGYTNVSSLASYLLLAYSAGILITTPLAAFFFHRYPYRRSPLLGGLFALTLGVILLMLARPFWCMVVARLMQGVASALVWNVGMAMICENVDDNVVGRQLGYAMSGLAVGTSIGPVIGGILYDKLGWNAPFIFCIGCCVVDFIGRLLVIERKDLPAQSRQTLSASTDKANTDAAAQTKINETDDVKDHTLFTNASPEDKTITSSPYELQATTSRTSAPTAPPKQLGPLEVLVQLGRSPRALTAFGLEFTYAIIMAALEPTLTLRVQSVWHKDAFFIGIIYLIAAVPTFFTGPIAGAMADKWGSEVLTIPLLVLCLPLPPLLILKQSLPGFIIILTFANGLLSSLLSPVALEVAMVAKTQEGIGEIHQIGGMNMAYGLGACIGPIISGQIYDHIGGGWNVLSWAYMGILAINLIPVFLYTGQRPWANRLFGRDTGTGRGEKVGDTKEVDNKHTDSSVDVA